MTKADNKKVVPVFFAVNDSYTPYLSVALSSAVKNSSPDRLYRAIVLHDGVSEENQKKLRALAADNFAVDFVAMEKGLESITDIMSNRLRCEYFTLTIYFRLFIPTMFPEYDKAIYLDGDVVVLDDIAKLYDTELGDNYIGACQDHSCRGIEPFERYFELSAGVDRSKYVNSGVLLMDLKKLRDLNFGSHFLSLLNTYHFDSVAPDQDYINAICADKIYYLSPSWDRMPNDRNPIDPSPSLIHYNLFAKPWCYDNIQYSDIFWEYAEGSPYRDVLRAEKDSFDEEKKAADRETLNFMLKRAIEISAGEVTFKKIYDSGVKIRL